MVADVGARIRSLRTAKGLTQAQLAEPQYTKAYISMLESGRTRASMKALEHIAGVLGVKPADLLGGAPSPATPQFSLLEARRLIEQGNAIEALPILESLEEGLTPADQLFRLRYLAVAYNLVGQPKAAFPLIERAQRMAELLNDQEEQIRVKAVLAAAYTRTYAYEEAILNSQKSLLIYEELGLLDQVACALDNAAALYVEHGNTTRARECLARAARIAEEVRRDTTLASIRASEAELLARTDADAALEQAQQVLKFARRVEQADAQVRMLLLTGELRMKSSSATARRSFQEARQLAEEKAPQLLRIIFDRWSRAAEAGGDSDEALRLARRALETVRV